MMTWNTKPLSEIKKEKEALVEAENRILELEKKIEVLTKEDESEAG